MVDHGDTMITNANDLLAQAKNGKGLIGRLMNDKQTADDFSDLLAEAKNGKGLVPRLLNDKQTADNFSALIANMKVHGPVFYHDDTPDKDQSDDGSQRKNK